MHSPFLRQESFSRSKNRSKDQGIILVDWQVYEAEADKSGDIEELPSQFSLRLEII